MKQIFKAIVGSQAYGTATSTSDTDYKGVYMQSTEELISFGYKEQTDNGKDETHYEVRRFLQLAQSANPTMLELLFMPEQFILTITPEFELIRAHRTKFLTKRCAHSFGGYAIAQIKKAKGLDKKMNWETGKMERKTPLDFCYVYQEGKTVPLQKWLKTEGKSQEFCGLVALDHFRDCYAMYYDYHHHYGTHLNRICNPLGYKGIVLDDSNSVLVSSVSKGSQAEAIIHYNKDGYSQHCKSYREYHTWLEERNTQRYVDNTGHNQKIDGKNLLHCRRLLDMALEIANEGAINVLRPNREYLLQIRRGEVPLDDIIGKAEQDIAHLDSLYQTCSLPDDVDRNFVNDLLLEVRMVSFINA